MYVTRATAHVEHAHPGAHARREQDSSRDRVNDARLMTETPDLAIGMDENIRDVNVGTSATGDFMACLPHTTVPQMGASRWSTTMRRCGSQSTRLAVDLNANVASGSKSWTLSRRTTHANIVAN